LADGCQQICVSWHEIADFLKRGIFSTAKKRVVENIADISWAFSGVSQQKQVENNNPDEFANTNLPIKSAGWLKTGRNS
jgi:hypothetical protein